MPELTTEKPAALDVPPPVSKLRKWFALVVISVSQLMIVLDATIVTVALPTMTNDLEISPADRQWVMTAYLIAFGGLLLLGGRVADYLGRKKTFIIALLGFAAVSALGGFANELWLLLIARAGQGVFAALMAPAGLALLSVSFTDAKERSTAFAIYGACASGGSVIGLVLGGVFTDYLSWRWCLWVNTPIAIVAALVAIPFLIESKAAGKPRLDVPGALLATGGLVAIVYGFSEAERNGWSADRTMALLAAGVAILVLFVVVQAKVKEPLLPLRIVMHRSRGGANLAMLLAASSLMGAFLILTFYMQAVLGYSELKAGLAFMPFNAGVLLAMPLVARLGPRIPPRYLIVVGAASAAIEVGLIMRFQTDSGYATEVLPVMLFGGFGLGMVFLPTINCGTLGVDERDLGVAGAAINTSQQIGAALGIALANTIAANRASDFLEGKVPSPPNFLEAQVEGYQLSGFWAMVVAVVAGVVTFFLIDARKLDTASMEAVPPPPTGPAPAKAEPGFALDPAPGEPDRAVVSTQPMRIVPDYPDAKKISVTVRDQTGAAIPMTALTLLDQAGRGMSRTRTGEDGAGELTVPDLGSYVLVARAGGQPPQAMTVQVTGPTVPLEVVLQSISVLTGAVRGVNGHGPLPDATVTVTDAHGTVVATERTGPAGNYEVRNLTGGDYTLVVSAPRFRPEAMRVAVGGTGATRRDVELSASGQINGIALAGRHGGPLADAQVTLIDGTGTIVGSALTAEDGRYGFEDLHEGSYTLVATGFPPVSETVQVVAGEPVEHRVVLSHPPVARPPD